MPSFNAQLDHVVLLLPYEQITAPPSWITDNFTLSEGGRHADGKTENRLVLFQDGTYLELIAFINDDPEKRRGHWWDKPFGVVDFALTTPDQAFPELAAIKDRLSRTETGISYGSPNEGGRLKPDGQELQWKVTFPINTIRGTAPFFCHDVTPRDRRVPCTEGNTKHPSGAIGMAGVTLKAANSARLIAATAAILDEDSSLDGRYTINVPHDVPRAKKPSIRIEQQDPASDTKMDLSLSLVLQSPQDHPDICFEMAGGTISVVFEKPS